MYVSIFCILCIVYCIRYSTLLCVYFVIVLYTVCVNILCIQCGVLYRYRQYIADKHYIKIQFIVTQQSWMMSNNWYILYLCNEYYIEIHYIIAAQQSRMVSANWYILPTRLHSLHSLAAHKSIPTPFSSALSSTPKTLSFLPFQLQLCHIEMEELEEKLEIVNTYISWVCRCLFSEMSLARCITHFLHSKSTGMSSTSQIIWKSSIWKPCRVSSSAGRT